MVDYGLSKPGPASAAAALTRAPEVFPPRWFRYLMASIFNPTIASTVPSWLPRLPPWLRYLIALGWVLNAKNSLGVWHVRLFWQPVLHRMRAVPAVHPLLPWIRSESEPTRKRGAEPRLKLDSLPLGEDIFERKTTWTHWADFADSDWNMHLSNSSYASRLDFVRAEHVINSFILSHFDGCMMALGGTVFHYHREIPMFSKYAITVQTLTWDHKWIYFIAKWTNPPDSVDHEAAEVLEQTKPKRSLSSVELRKFAASVLQSQREADAKEKEKGQASGSEGTTSTAPASSSPSGATSTPTQAGKGKKEKKQVVYSTAISRYCFKAGRKTIPPWFIVATGGFGTWASTRENFDQAEKLRIDTLAQAQREYAATHSGSAMPRDGVLAGRGFRQAGLGRLFDLSRPEGAGGDDDERGLGKYQDRASWATAEWEERRIKGLEALREIGNVVPPAPSSLSGSGAGTGEAGAGGAGQGYGYGSPKGSHQALSAAAVSALGTPTGMATPQGGSVA